LTICHRRPPGLCENNSLFTKPDFFVECSQLDYHGAAHWAKTDYGLSAGQHAVLPEGKGTGKAASLTL